MLSLLINPFLEEQAKPSDRGAEEWFLLVAVLLSPITLPSLVWHRAGSARHRLEWGKRLFRRVARKAQTLWIGL